MQTAFLIRVSGKLRHIPFDDVLLINAKNNYCEIVTNKNKKWLTQVSMNYMEQKLPENLFLRAHRSHIISLNKIDCLDANTVEIGEFKVPLSKAGHAAITKRLLIICPDYDRKLKEEIEGLSTEQYIQRINSSRKNIQ